MIQEERTPMATDVPPKQRKSAGDLLDTSLIVMVVGLMFAIVCAFLVNFVFDPELDWKEVGVDTIVVTVCTVAIYLLLRSYMQRKGRKSAVWKGAKERMEGLGRRVIESDYARYMTAYCREWESVRLDDDCKTVLERAGLSLNDYKTDFCKYSKKELRAKFPELTAEQVKTVLAVKKIKRLHYNERYLCVNAHSGSKGAPSGGMTTGALNVLETVRTAVTTVLTSLLSVSFLSDIIWDFSAEAVVACVVKLAIIVFFGAIGMIGGWNFTTVKEVREMQAKSDELETFIKWVERKKTEG